MVVAREGEAKDVNLARGADVGAMTEERKGFDLVEVSSTVYVAFESRKTRDSGLPTLPFT
jgi:hypothetical protein